METEQAIKLLEVKLQDPYQIFAAKKIKQILHSNNQNHTTQKRQERIIKSINNKLANEHALIVRVDKGKTIVIMKTDEYTQKVNSFPTENNFQKLNKDPTNKYHKHLLKTMQQCNLIIDKNN
jgi:hypothetical protein